jgi:hypothetical protein
VAGVRLRILVDQLVLVEFEEIPGVSHIERVRDHLLRRDSPAEVLIVQTVGTSEVRNAALRGDTCAAEKYYIVTLVNYLLKLFDFRLRSITSPFPINENNPNLIIYFNPAAII